MARSLQRRAPGAAAATAAGLLLAACAGAQRPEGTTEPGKPAPAMEAEPGRATAAAQAPSPDHLLATPDVADPIRLVHPSVL